MLVELIQFTGPLMGRFLITRDSRRDDGVPRRYWMRLWSLLIIRIFEDRDNVYTAGEKHLHFQRVSSLTNAKDHGLRQGS